MIMENGSLNHLTTHSPSQIIRSLGTKLITIIIIDTVCLLLKVHGSQTDGRIVFLHSYLP
jgi:hypothetical protein